MSDPRVTTPGEASEDMEPVTVGRFHCTQQGNAERLIARYGHSLRYCHDWGTWLKWDGKRWNPVKDGKVMQLAIRTVKAIHKETSMYGDSEQDRQIRQYITSHAYKSEAKSNLEAMVSLAQSDPSISLIATDLDKDPYRFNCQNGVIDLRTGEFLEHRQDQHLTKISPVTYNREAECPMFLSFLNRIFAENQRLISYVQRAFGYALTGDVSVRSVSLCCGEMGITARPLL